VARPPGDATVRPTAAAGVARAADSAAPAAPDRARVLSLSFGRPGLWYARNLSRRPRVRVKGASSQSPPPRVVYAARPRASRGARRRKADTVAEEAAEANGR